MIWLVGFVVTFQFTVMVLVYYCNPNDILAQARILLQAEPVRNLLMLMVFMMLVTRRPGRSSTPIDDSM